MNFTRHFFIEGQYLGSTPVGFERVRDSNRVVPPRGHSFFCPYCGRLWAECPVENQGAMVWTRGCKDHAAGSIVGGFPAGGLGSMMVHTFEAPGSIHLPWEEGFSASFPPKVIEWEFVRHLHWYGSTFDDEVASICRDMLPYISTANKRS